MLTPTKKPSMWSGLYHRSRSTIAEAGSVGDRCRHRPRRDPCDRGRRCCRSRPVRTRRRGRSCTSSIIRWRARPPPSPPFRRGLEDSPRVRRLPFFPSPASVRVRLVPRACRSRAFDRLATIAPDHTPAIGVRARDHSNRNGRGRARRTACRRHRAPSVGPVGTPPRHIVLLIARPWAMAFCPTGRGTGSEAVWAASPNRWIRQRRVRRRSRPGERLGGR
jgi:hypothetical protein